MTAPSQTRAVGIAVAALALTLALTLIGCGKKPGIVEPPQGAAADTFPHRYPNPKLDPRPVTAAGEPVPESPAAAAGTAPPAEAGASQWPPPPPGAYSGNAVIDPLRPPTPLDFPQTSPLSR
ncbi:MAG: hypothetical protein GC191_13210 [Azospirillum sp.]|nr:hypothetical protein [Azospirillum sp.]